MKRLQWYLQRSATALGAPGMIGLALMIAAAVIEFGFVQPGKRDNIRLQQHIASLKQYPQPGKSSEPALELADFYALFPTRAVISQQVRTLHELANYHHLDMGRVDYKLSAISGTPLHRYRLSYKIVTEYPVLRRYLADILLKLPNAAIENIELQRFNDNTGVPESQLNVVLYFRDGP